MRNYKRKTVDLWVAHSMMMATMIAGMLVGGYLNHIGTVWAKEEAEYKERLTLLDPNGYARAKGIIVPVPLPQYSMATMSAVSAPIKDVKEDKYSIKIKKASLVSKRTIQCIKNRPEVAEKIQAKFGDDSDAALDLFCRESGLNIYAKNPSSGACGMVQSLPCSKLTKVCEMSDTDCQIQWGYDYVMARYGSATKAIQFHNRNNWY